MLPCLPEKLLKQISEKLLDRDVECAEDLLSLKGADILDFLQPIPCQNLPAASKHKTNVKTISEHESELLLLLYFYISFYAPSNHINMDKQC